MLVTHIGHACLLIEAAGVRVLLDPGSFSHGFEELSGLDAVMITHAHPDHYDAERLPALLEANEGARLIVEPEHADSGFAGAVALAIIMLPLIARSSQEVLRLVPGSLREAADALGVERWRAIVGIILPTALGGILTGLILAVARAAGETAPLLIVDGTFTNATTLQIFGHPVPNIPVSIFLASEAADPTGFARAWGEALVLLALILLANVGARLLLTRTRERSGR